MISLPDKSRGSPPETVWEVDGPFGVERWFREGNLFTRVECGHKSLSLLPESDDLDQLLPRAAACQHPGPWPNAFKFCPDCGKPLLEPSAWPPAKLWCAPFGAADGLPCLNINGTPDANTRQKMPLPTPASLAFVVAGTPARLFAFDMIQGRLHRWIEAAEADQTSIGGYWRELLRLSSTATMPRWSWSAVAFESGFAFPTDSGPAWVGAAADRPLSETLEHGAGPAIGGAARLRAVAAIPIVQAGTICVSYWLAAAEPAAWRAEAVPGTQGAAGKQRFAMPVTVHDEAFWPGEKGQLYASTNGDRLTTFYRPWPEGFQPLLGVRPTRDANGVLYQLGRTNGETPILQALLRPNATALQQTSRGIGMSCGVASFREGKRYDAPWETTARAEYLLDDGQFLAPLLAFGNGCFLLAVCSPRRELLSFVGTSPPQRPRLECRIAFSTGSRNLAELNLVIRADSLCDISAFIFRHHLYVYDACANACWRWALDGMDRGFDAP